VTLSALGALLHGRYLFRKGVSDIFSDLPPGTSLTLM
jgi:hypothetical protein